MRLHVHRDDDGDWEIWLNTDVADFDGLCIGTGRTRERAANEALMELVAHVERLRRIAYTGTEDVD